MSTDWRAELQALLSAYDAHGGRWPQHHEDALMAAVEHARAALAAEPDELTLSHQPEFPGKTVWEQGSTLGIAPDEQTARTDAARAVEPVAAQRTDVAPIQVALARVERLADDFSSACRPLIELAEKLAAEPVVERSPLVSLSALLHPAYEPGDGSADGAQMVEMAWWHPVMGCDSLQIVVDNARAALAEPVATPARPTDEELDAMERQCYLATEVCNDSGCEYVFEHRRYARAVLARFGHHSPGATKMVGPAEGDVAELVAWLRGANWDSKRWTLATRAADLVEQRHPAPVPVAERLPGPEDCDGEERCWLLVPRWILPPFELTHWLPANALPLPAGEAQP